MSRFLTAPFDLQCLTIQRLTNWSDIQTILSLYPTNTSQYQRAADCVRQILRNPHQRIDRTKIRLDELIQFHNLEAADYLVTIPFLEYQTSFNQLGSLRKLTVSSIFSFNEIITAFSKILSVESTGI